MRISIIIISKDEESLGDTLVEIDKQIESEKITSEFELDVTVVDASEGRLSHIEQRFQNVQWIDFLAPEGVNVSIPHQRNCGLQRTRGEIVVFIDAGCLPQEGWLRRLIAPLVNGSERMTCGPSWIEDNVFSPERGTPIPTYVNEAPTINLAFLRELIEEVGNFDESFEYGSDCDFTRRVASSGTKIRFVADAVVVHDWGTFRRQLKRSRHYGAARIRLASKHSEGFAAITRNEPVPVLYALFIVGLPVTLRFRSYLLLLAIPLWRARKRPFPVQVVLCHLAEGIGGIQEMARIYRLQVRSRR